MSKYRKKPVVIEAYQIKYTLGWPYKVTIKEFNRWPQWLRSAFDKKEENGVFVHDNGMLVVFTLEGLMEVSDGDYIIQGVKGELYPCKEDIFHLTYDAVEELE